MTEQEKELVEIMKESKYSGNTLHLEEYAKAIISCYPQVLAEKVQETECFDVYRLMKNEV